MLRQVIVVALQGWWQRDRWGSTVKPGDLVGWALPCGMEGGAARTLVLL